MKSITSSYSLFKRFGFLHLARNYQTSIVNEFGNRINIKTTKDISPRGFII